MSKFAVEVKVSGPKGPEWRQMKPSGAKPPYRFDTEDQAENIRKMCYGAPEHVGVSRVVPVEE